MVSRAVTAFSAAVVLVVVSASTAFADAPTEWATAPERSVLDWLVLLFGIPAVIGAGVALFGLATARTNYEPPAASTAVERAAGGAGVVHH